MLNGPKGKIKSVGGVRKPNNPGFFGRAAPSRVSGWGMRDDFAIVIGHGKT